MTAEKTWQRAYEAAKAANATSYIDPQTGFSVFTEKGLLERGYCCQSGCRHCPYGFKAPDGPKGKVQR